VHPADHRGPLVFVDDLEAPVLGDGDRHHLRRVLRARPGDPLTIADGAGRWRTARLGDEPEPTGPVQELPAAHPEITVGFALVKGDRPELVVQKLTELGVDRIVPLRAERSVVRWDAAKGAAALERLRAVARSAAMQCHRPRLPEVAGVADVADLAGGAGVAMADRDGEPPSLDRPTVLVGPEGGWTDAERSLCTRVGLGPNVLRAETAAITVGVILTALRAGIVRLGGED
jgi:16S rRNA (uracil1498-N3)-methyltransferase